MKPSPIPFAPLYEAQFVNETSRLAIQAQASLGDKAPVQVAPQYSRDPDEHEFYLLGVGKALAEVLTCCEHLQNIPALLTNFRESESTKKVGLNRQRHIVYHIESYIIRVQGLFDRVLKLLDAVFHLLNAPRNCRSHIILKNRKVVHHQKVLASVKQLDKLLNKYAVTRNEVIHEASFQEDRLRRLEMYYIAQTESQLDPTFPQRDYPGLIRELAREIVKEKKVEFMEFNLQLSSAIQELLSNLYPCYIAEEKALRLRLGKAAT